MTKLVRFLLPLALLCSVGEPTRAQAASAPSDPAAVRLARRVLKAMGGREAWEETRFFAWNFHGRRFHVWDSWTGELRTDAADGTTILMNLHTLAGRAFRDGEALAGEELAAALAAGESAWINDSYWLVMPFKLLDEGVRLRGPRPALGPGGEEALALRLTFDGVGRTPWNAYDVLVDPRTHAVAGWSYYRNASDAEPLFTLPWELERRGRLLLPAGHGRQGEWEVAVFDEIPPSVFADAVPRMTMATLLAMATPAVAQEPGR